jgi:hypothetical protein
MADNEIDLLKLAEKIGLKGRWLGNADPSAVIATPDGKGYIVSGAQHTNATLGEPLRPFGDLLFKDPSQAANGIVGIYERATSFENLLKKPSDEKIRFDGDEYLFPKVIRNELGIIPEQGLKNNLLDFGFGKR